MKLKTHQASKKRFKLTRRGKYIKRAAGQDHFNAREGGKAGRNKRRDFTIDSINNQTLKTLNPYNL